MLPLHTNERWLESSLKEKKPVGEGRQQICDHFLDRISSGDGIFPLQCSGHNWLSDHGHFLVLGRESDSTSCDSSIEHPRKSKHSRLSSLLDDGFRQECVVDEEYDLVRNSDKRCGNYPDESCRRILELKVISS